METTVDLLSSCFGSVGRLLLVCGVIEVIEVRTTRAQSRVVAEHLHERRNDQTVAKCLIQVAFDGLARFGGHLPIRIFVTQHSEDLVVMVLVDVPHQSA